MAIDYALCSVCQQNPSIFNALLSLTCLSWNVARDKQTMETLARAAQSTPSLQQLIQSGLLTTLTQTIVDFSHSVLEHPPTQMNPSLDSVTVALDFLTLLCEEWGCGTTRDILASNLDPHLLKLLLKTLCSYTDCSLLSEVEDAAVAFFRQFCWAHPDNSRRFAQILLDVLQPIGKYLVPVVVNFLIETFVMFQE